MNSTGRVTSWNSTARLNIRIPTWTSGEPRPPNKIPRRIMGQESWEPKFATGTRALRNRSGP